ncbi:adenylate cyclase [Paramagnetospirillum marisnigri]|uniref:Adenylate cyclase n=1 Tax=Paramagnetospirillum marisnigri TaxID=1285242 RepID=A0A178MKE8_9PROT|nr:adenylate/guanylate cyclase domain-containing protein [Paramagnetospirillum marisnigri]OAN49146.1 adenylate cyclase [Paramagnetospirillum marisnigri]
MTLSIEPADQPFPILRLFRTRLVPGLALSAVLLLGGGWVSVTSLEKRVYLETTQRRVENTVRLVERAEPQTWERLLSGESPALVLADPAGARARFLLEETANDGHVLQLKIFNERGITLYATDPADLGVREENALMRQVLRDKKPQIETTQRDNLSLYEIYVPINTKEHTIAFEVYEPSSILDEVIVESFSRFAVLPIVILLGFGLWLQRVVTKAQADIDGRVEVQQTLRRQLERFVSQSAGLAARQSPGGQVPTTRAGMTLFYSDVRDFTSLAEFHPPKATVEFLNELMTRQVEIVTTHGGDVDKMIGDALLVRFEGSDREARALAAAQSILIDLAAHPMARAIGIGIYDGEAILGAIGPKERQDFTVIGDSVNLAARLCSLAEENQLVIDEQALRRSGLPDDGFSPAEENKVKGRKGLVSVRRWSPSV